MENKKKRQLYPLLFKPEAIETPWGETTVALADMGSDDTEAANGWLAGSTLSDIMETYLERISGDNVYDYFGRQFPLMVKTLKVRTRTPLMVCPDDEIAGQRYDTLGKMKLWYVVDADPGSKLYMGFNEDIAAAELYERSLDGTLEAKLNVITPHVGEAFIIPPGLVHAAAGNIVIAEIAEASDLDFRIFSWGNADAHKAPISFSYTGGKKSSKDLDNAGLDELSLEAAFDFVNMKRYDETLRVNEKSLSSRLSGYVGLRTQAPVDKEDKVSDKLASLREFSVTRIGLTDAIHIYNEESGSFLVYYCVSGEASFQVVKQGGTPEDHVLKPEGAILVPADVQDFFIVPRDRNTVLLEAAIEPREDIDDYIDPEAEEKLPGDDDSKDDILFSNRYEN